MAEQISKREIASVQLFTVEVSEDEVAVLVACLNYVLSHASNQVLERVIGAYRDEVEVIRDDLSQMLDELEPEIRESHAVVEPA
ncbi:MAG: hypothetical protein U0350_23805 [Caldilineaceae bacterium]